MDDMEEVGSVAEWRAIEAEPPQFVPDKWLYVVADDAEAARRFFGAPEGWPVKFDGFSRRGPGRVWRVLAEGLTVCPTSA